MLFSKIMKTIIMKTLNMGRNFCMISFTIWNSTNLFRMFRKNITDALNASTQILNKQKMFYLCGILKTRICLIISFLMRINQLVKFFLKHKYIF